MTTPNNLKTVKDVFVTVKKKNYSETHPFEVYLRFTDGTTSQPVDNRTLRDCLICGNGMLHALSGIGHRYETVNVVFDPIFDR